MSPRRRAPATLPAPGAHAHRQPGARPAPRDGGPLRRAAAARSHAADHRATEGLALAAGVESIATVEDEFVIVLRPEAARRRLGPRFHDTLGSALARPFASPSARCACSAAPLAPAGCPSSKTCWKNWPRPRRSRHDARQLALARAGALPQEATLQWRRYQPPSATSGITTTAEFLLAKVHGRALAGDPTGSLCHDRRAGAVDIGAVCRFPQSSSRGVWARRWGRS